MYVDSRFACARERLDLSSSPCRLSVVIDKTYGLCIKIEFAIADRWTMLDGADESG